STAACGVSPGGDAVAVAPGVYTRSKRLRGGPGPVEGARAPPGRVDWNRRPPARTANARGSSFSLCTISAVEPSGFRNATSMIWPFQPVVPNDVLATRTAPGFTNFDRCPIV